MDPEIIKLFGSILTMVYLAVGLATAVQAYSIDTKIGVPGFLVAWLGWIFFLGR